MFQLFLSETVDYLSNSGKKWNVFTRAIEILVKPSRYYIFIASLLYFFHVSAVCFNMALNLSIKENVLQYVKILFIIFPEQIRSERLNSLCHLLTENFPCSLTLSKYPKQLFAHLPVRLSKNKKPLTMMWTIYILRKVKYQNVFDQMNIEVLSSQGFFPGKGGGEGDRECCKLPDRPTGYTIQQVIAS